MKKDLDVNNYFSIDSRIFINIFSLFGIYFINFLISLISLPFLIKNYGLNKWGEIVLCQIFLNYLIWIIDWSFNQYGSKFVSINNNLKKQKIIVEEIWSAQLILTIFTMIIALLISIVWYKYRLIFLYFNLSLIGNFLQPYWFLNGLERNYESAILQLFNKVLFTLSIFLFINPESDISNFFLIFGSCFIITGILYQLRIQKIYKNRLDIVSFSKSISVIKKSSSLYFSSVFASFINTSIPLIISYFLGATNLGIYNVADRIKGICSQLTNPISHAIFPRIAKKYSKDKKEGNNMLKKVILFVLPIVLFAYFLLNIKSTIVVSFFTNENISSVIMVLRILLISFVINVINEILIYQYMIPNGHYKSINNLRIIMLISTIIFCLALINKFGLMGAAFANLFSECLGFFIIASKFTRTINQKSNPQVF